MSERCERTSEWSSPDSPPSHTHTRLVKINEIAVHSELKLTIRNRRIKFIDMNFFAMSSGASERVSKRTNERSGARERIEQRGASE